MIQRLQANHRLVDPVSQRKAGFRLYPENVRRVNDEQTIHCTRPRRTRQPTQ